MSNSLTPEQEKLLKKVEELFLENIETVFQTGISPEAVIKFGAISHYKSDLVSANFPDGAVVVKIAHKNNASGDEYVLLSTRTAALISDLMVMGDGKAEFSPDEHLDAVQEIIDQIYGAFALSMEDSKTADLDYKLAKAQVYRGQLKSVADDSWTAVKFELNLQGNHQIFHLLSPAASRNLILTSGKTDEQKAPASESPGKGKDSAHPAQFKSFGTETPSEQAFGEIEMLMDLSLPIIIELGRTTMYIKDILNLTPGSIIELDKLSGDPVDIYVNEKKFAEGEVVVIDENFGIRITDLVKPEDRVRKLS